MRRRFSILLGAGCSVSAGVPLASGILKDAKAELYRTFHPGTAVNESAIADWLETLGRLQNPLTAYGEALDWLYPNPRLRRIFLERYFVDKEPAPAHFAFASLVEKEIFRGVYTTNFDDLVEKAYRKMGTIRVVTHGEQAEHVDLRSDIPTIFKLHGDYLFDNLANTQAECSELSRWEAEKLRLGLAEDGLVIVGYSGNDESIMTILEDVSQAPAPLGLFWLGLKGSEPIDRAKQLIETHPTARYSVTTGFDSFITSLFKKTISLSGTASYSLPPTAAQRPFVAHEEGLLALKNDVMGAVETSGCPIVVISGLPGVGKTTIAQEIVRQLRSSFPSVIEISARNKPITLAELMDDCLNRLGIPRIESLDREQTKQSIFRFLATNKTLMFLDNFEIISGDLRNFLSSIPAPSKVLLTLRSAPAELTGGLNEIVEFIHQGLSDAEMKDLLSRLVGNSHELRRKFDGIDRNSCDEIISRLRGWPEALVLFLGKLNNPTVPTSEYQALLSSSDLYSSLLNDTYAHLTETARTVLKSAAAFPGSCSTEGLSAVCNYGIAKVEKGLQELIERGLISSTSASRFTFSHPIVSTFSRKKLEKTRRGFVVTANDYLISWIRSNGGQPAADWSNFARMDREFENIKIVLTEFEASKNYKLLTIMVRHLFSYVVERGHWLYMNDFCDKILNSNISNSLRADWLIWKSWIAFYLKGDYCESANYANGVLAMKQINKTQLFEGHRRAALAYSFLQDFEAAADQLAKAKKICKTSWASSSDQNIDLNNLEGYFWLQKASNGAEPKPLESAWRAFDRAEKISSGRRNPNTREIGVSLVGKAHVLMLFGKTDEALSAARRASEHAWAIGWLRGIAESNEMVSRLALKMHDLSLSASAKQLADGVSEQLGKITIIL